MYVLRDVSCYSTENIDVGKIEIPKRRNNNFTVVGFKYSKVVNFFLIIAIKLVVEM